MNTPNMRMFALVLAVSFSGTAQAALQGRDLDGNIATFEAYYDTDLNITWLADANVGDLMSWADANTWATNLNITDTINNITYDNWRLPTVIDTGTPGCNYAYMGTDCGYNVNTTTGEMAHLYYEELHNLALFNSAGGWGAAGGLANTGPFINLQGEKYWSGTEYLPGASEAGYFNFYSGGQLTGDKGYGMYALAVSPGDIAAVPEPETYAMMLAGLGLLGIRLHSRKNIRL